MVSSRAVLRTDKTTSEKAASAGAVSTRNDTREVDELHGKAVQTLVEWYQVKGRRLPWRETTNPYKIWLSEVMLQQTRVETVVPYYHAVVTQYPTIADLAHAADADLLKLWQGLGYYSRIRNLHQAAQTVLERFAGQVPDNAMDFASLKGVGPYTVGAVMSIAFNQPVPAVDGNVTRVMARVFAISEDVTRSSVRRFISQQVSRWLQCQPPRLLTQALMELGAVICKPRNPDCTQCPLAGICESRAKGLASCIPVRTPKVVRKQVQVVALLCQDGDRILLERRPATGLLASMWQFPAVEIQGGDLASDEYGRVVDELLTRLHQPYSHQPSFQQPYSHQSSSLSSSATAAATRWGTPSGTDNTVVLAADSTLNGDYPVADGFLVAERSVCNFRLVTRLEHQFTHMDWHVTVLQPVGYDWGRICETESRRWADSKMLTHLALPRVYDKLIAAIQNPAGT